MNKVILMGRLTRDPEVRYTQGESATAVARFTLAVDRRFKRDGEQNADFISCVAFGKGAEFIEKYFRQLHQPGRTEGIHHGCGAGRAGVCREQAGDRGRREPEAEPGFQGAGSGCGRIYEYSRWN